MRFIELTTASTGITIWLNTSHIVGFYYEPTTEATVVTVHGEKDEVQVKESPQQLLSVLGGSGGFVGSPVTVGGDPASAPS